MIGAGLRWVRERIRTTSGTTYRSVCFISGEYLPGVTNVKPQDVERARIVRLRRLSSENAGNNGKWPRTGLPGEPGSDELPLVRGFCDDSEFPVGSDPKSRTSRSSSPPAWLPLVV